MRNDTQAIRRRQATALSNRTSQLQAWKDGKHELSGKDKKRNLLPEALKKDKIDKASAEIKALKKVVS